MEEISIEQMQKLRDMIVKNSSEPLQLLAKVALASFDMFLENAIKEAQSRKGGRK